MNLQRVAARQAINHKIKANLMDNLYL